MNHQEQINHDKHPDESKTRTHRLSKLPDDEASMEWGNICIYKYINYLVHMTKMAAMRIYIVKTLKKSSPNLVDRFQRNLA